MKKKSIKELLAEKKNKVKTGTDASPVVKAKPKVTSNHKQVQNSASTPPKRLQNADETKSNSNKNIFNYTENDTDSTVNLVSFQMGKHFFGMDILKVQEVVKPHEITRVPHVDKAVMGVVNLRGTITPVVNLRKHLGLSDKSFTEKTRIIIVKVNEQTVGITVDSVSEIIRVPHNKIEEPPESISGVDSKYISGIAKLNKNGQNQTGMVVVLAPELIFDKKARRSE